MDSGELDVSAGYKELEVIGVEEPLWKSCCSQAESRKPGTIQVELTDQTMILSHNTAPPSLITEHLILSEGGLRNSRRERSPKNLH